MSPEKPDDSFRVIDRRLFNAEGELRKEALEQERAETPANIAPATQPPKNAAPAQATPAPAPAPDTPSAAAEPAASSGPFQALVDFLSQNAAMLLGAYADPRTGQAVLDLDGARELIDMIDVLREKTRGNLAPEDDQFLAERIGRLKYTYLEMTKAAAQAMRERANRKP